MATRFCRDDSQSCFRCNASAPSFRWIALERYPNEEHNLESACVVGLFCESCIKLEINDYFDSFAQNSEPVGPDETSEEYLSREFSFAVLPLMLSEIESSLLAHEIVSDSMKTAIN